MNWSRLQTVFVAMLLLVVSSYCATECTLTPCHEKATQPAPCHQHPQQPKHDEAPQDCLHSQLVMDTQATVSLNFDLIPFEYVAILQPISELASLAIPDEVAPPLSPQQILSTVLRV